MPQLKKRATAFGILLLLTGCQGDPQPTAQNIVVPAIAYTQVQSPNAATITTPQVEDATTPKTTPQVQSSAAPTNSTVKTKSEPTTVSNQTNQVEKTPVQTAPEPATPVKTYTNSSGNEVQSPTYSDSQPQGATARCNDGTYSFSQHHSGTCSHHGGVASWL